MSEYNAYHLRKTSIFSTIVPGFVVRVDLVSMQDYLRNLSWASTVSESLGYFRIETCGHKFNEFLKGLK